jgi:hypothetical protein
MAAQFLTTSRLSNIINMISLGRQSGILRVIRGQGPTREIGQIKFLDGDPTTALLGQLTGQNALTVLANWGECVYSFDEQAIGDIDGDMLYDGSGRAPSDPGRYVPSAPSSGSWPSYGYSASYPTSYPASPPMGGGMTSPSLPGYAQQGYGTPPSGYPAYDTPRGGYGPPAAASQTASQLTASQITAVPRRTVMAEHVDQLPLDRRERMLLLLVDGRRTLADLARLTRRNEREVLGVLDHLSTLGLVQISG